MDGEGTIFRIFKFILCFTQESKNKNKMRMLICTKISIHCLYIFPVSKQMLLEDSFHSKFRSGLSNEQHQGKKLNSIFVSIQWFKLFCTSAQILESAVFHWVGVLFNIEYTKVISNIMYIIKSTWPKTEKTINLPWQYMIPAFPHLSTVYYVSCLHQSSLGIHDSSFSARQHSLLC